VLLLPSTDKEFDVVKPVTVRRGVVMDTTELKLPEGTVRLVILLVPVAVKLAIDPLDVMARVPPETAPLAVSDVVEIVPVPEIEVTPVAVKLAIDPLDVMARVPPETAPVAVNVVVEIVPVPEIDVTPVAVILFSRA